MAYDPNLLLFSVFLQVFELTLCALMLVISYLYIRKIAYGNWTPFNVVLMVLMTFSVILTGMAGTAPKETMAYRLGLDVLPIDPTMLLVDAVVTSIAYYEFLIGEIYISYLRSLSIIRLRPIYEQYLLKIGVFSAMSFFQASMVFFLLNFLTNFTYVPCQITGALAGLIYFFIDFYYLFQFIRLIQKHDSKQDRKLLLIAKYGIFNALIFFTTLMFFITSLSGIFLIIWVSVSPWITTVAFAKMGYELQEKALPALTTTSLSLPSTLLSEKK